MEIELCKLVDGKLSVRADGQEVHILPSRRDCGLDDLTEAFQALADHNDDPDW